MWSSWSEEGWIQGQGFTDENQHLQTWGVKSLVEPLEPCALMNGPTENVTGCLSMFIPYHGHVFFLGSASGARETNKSWRAHGLPPQTCIANLKFQEKSVLSWPSQQKFPSTEEQDTKYIYMAMWYIYIYIQLYTYVTYGCAWKKSECRSQRSTISTALQAAGYHCPVVTDLGADRSKSQKIKKQMAFEAVKSGDFTHQSREIYGNLWKRNHVRSTFCVPFVDSIFQPGSTWPRLSVSRLQTPWLFAVSLGSRTRCQWFRQ